MVQEGAGGPRLDFSGASAGRPRPSLLASGLGSWTQPSLTFAPPSLLTFKFEDVDDFNHGTELHIQELRLSRERTPQTSSNLWGPLDPNRPVLGSTGKGCQGWGACSKALIQSVSVLPLALGPLCLEPGVTEEGRRWPTLAVAS